MGVYSEMAADLREDVQERTPAVQDAAELAARRADERQQAEEEQAKALLSQMQQNADAAPAIPDPEAEKKAEEDRKRQEHEQAEAKRKAEWEAKQRAKEEAEQAAWENAVAMSDDEVMAASMKRVGDDSERLTRRNMKISNADAAKELLAHMSVHKLQRYVEQQFAPEDEAALKRVDYYKMNTLITDYHDYLCMCKELQYDVKNSFILFPRELKAAHDSVAKTLKDKRTAEQEKAIAGSFDEWQKRYQYQSKELMMIPPHSAKEIVDEGAALHHCVRLYVKNVAEKRASFSL